MEKRPEVRLLEYAAVPGITICPQLLHAQEIAAKRFKKPKPSFSAPGIGSNGAFSFFLFPTLITNDQALLALVADYKKVVSYAEDLIQNARDRPSEAHALLEPCLAPLSATLADLECELRVVEFRLGELLSKRSSLLSKLVDVQTILGQPEQ